MAKKSLIKSIHDTMWDLMAGDERVLIMGEDVGTRGGVFRARFGRVALQQLAPFLLDTGEGLALLVSGARHPVRAAAAVI